MQRYEPLEDGVYKNINRFLNRLTLAVFSIGAFIIVIAVTVKYVHHNSNTPISHLFNYTLYDRDQDFISDPMFADRCLPMRPLLLEECEN